MYSTTMAYWREELHETTNQVYIYNLPEFDGFYFTVPDQSIVHFESPKYSCGFTDCRQYSVPDHHYVLCSALLQALPTFLVQQIKDPVTAFEVNSPHKRS